MEAFNNSTTFSARRQAYVPRLARKMTIEKSCGIGEDVSCGYSLPIAQIRQIISCALHGWPSVGPGLTTLLRQDVQSSTYETQTWRLRTVVSEEVTFLLQAYIYVWQHGDHDVIELVGKAKRPHGNERRTTRFSSFLFPRISVCFDNV